MGPGGENPREEENKPIFEENPFENPEVGTEPGESVEEEKEEGVEK